MRILLANESRAGAGGVETYLSATAEELRRRGHEVALLFANSAAEAGATFIATEDSWSVADSGLPAVLRHLRKWRPDVCFAHNMRELAIEEALLHEAPVVKMMHGYFGTCVSGQKAFLAPAATACARICGPACLLHYAPRRCGRRRPVEIVRNYQWAARQRALFPKYRSMVVASEHMRGEYMAHGIAADRVQAIPLFAVQSTRPSGDSRSVDVLFLGRMTELKGPALLLDALKRTSRVLGRRVSIVMAGEGPLRERLRDSSAETVGLDAAFPGWVGPRARTELFGRTAVLAVPSVWPEPFGLVGLEAAAFGIPSVAFDVGGIREWLTDDVNGRLIPAGDTAAMSDAITTLLRDPLERARLGAGAHAAVARFSPDAHLSKLEAVLDRARR